MGSNERRQNHRASLKREILDAASRLFVEEGFERVTMRRIAAQIEYSPTTIYLHFKDKDELLRAVCDETFSQLAARLERLQKTSGTPLGYLREGLRTYVDFGLANPNQYTLTFSSPDPGVDVGAFEGSAVGLVFEALRQGVRACVASGDIRTANIDMTAQALWASVHGLTELLTSKQDSTVVSATALADYTIDTLIAGLKTPAAAPRTPPHPQSKKWDFMD